MTDQEQCIFLGERMAGYDLGTADSRIRSILAKKKFDKMAELEMEFIYGKLPETDANGNTLFYMPDGTVKPIDTHHQNAKALVKQVYQEGGRPRPSTKNSPYCPGCISKGFSEEIARKIFDIMIAFASYSFNKSHSGAYAGIAFKCAYLSFYYPVEWAVACSATYTDKEKISDTIFALKKRGYDVLPPSINTSDTTFSVETVNGKKAMRYGLVDIPKAGARAVEVIKYVRDTHGAFTSFDDFINKCTNSNDMGLRNILGFNKNGNSNPNPLNIGCIVNLIKAGAFDDIEPNRHKLINYYLMQIKGQNAMDIGDKKKGTKESIPLPLDEANYKRKEKLAFEKEIMGGYISEHPLDPFPYVDLSTNPLGTISFAGIVISKASKPTKNGKRYTKVVVELKDSSEVVVNLFGKAHDDYAKFCTAGKIIIVQGRYSSQYNNVAADRIMEVVANQPQITQTNLSSIFDNAIPVKNDLVADLSNAQTGADLLESIFGSD